MRIPAAVLTGEGAASREGVLKDTSADIKGALHTEGDKKDETCQLRVVSEGNAQREGGGADMKTLWTGPM
jgi:hypothetical protein